MDFTNRFCFRGNENTENFSQGNISIIHHFERRDIESEEDFWQFPKISDLINLYLKEEVNTELNIVYLKRGDLERRKSREEIFDLFQKVERENTKQRRHLIKVQSSFFGTNQLMVVPKITIRRQTNDLSNQYIIREGIEIKQKPDFKIFQKNSYITAFYKDCKICNKPRKLQSTI